MFLWSKLSNVKWDDAWAERFHQHPGLVISRVGGKTTIRVEVYTETEAEAQSIAQLWGGRVRPVAEQNWMAQAVPRIEPIKIRHNLLIVSDSDPNILSDHQRQHPARQIISIPIEMAFGTGDHATTASVLRLLVDEAQQRRGQPWNCADIGCGTGLLAIAAAKLGAKPVSGFDYDPHAVAAAQRNAVLNQIEGQFQQLDLRQWQPREHYNVLCANVFADALCLGMPALAQALAANGTLLLSGILKVSLPAVQQAISANQLKTLRTLTRGKWQTLAVTHA